MKPSIDPLFTPIRYGAIEAPNRIAMAPLTRLRANDEDAPHALQAEHYRQRASAGLLICEATQISPQGKGYAGAPGIHSEAQIAGWKQVTDAVHEDGGRVVLQLWHVGRISHPALQPDGVLPVAPSAIRPEGRAGTYQGPQEFVTPRALQTNEMPGVIEQFRLGALNAKAAGFDGVEIHGANAYLLDQFLRDGTNHRTDQYGGSIENRARLLLEVTEAVASVWGADRVGVRVSPSVGNYGMVDSTPEKTFTYAASELGKFGLAFIHVVEPSSPRGDPNDRIVDPIIVREAFDGVYMGNGSYDGKRAREAISSGRADAISFGRPFISNPDLPRRLREDLPMTEPLPEFFYKGGAQGYTDYPSAA